MIIYHQSPKEEYTGQETASMIDLTHSNKKEVIELLEEDYDYKVTFKWFWSFKGVVLIANRVMWEHSKQFVKFRGKQL